jgi:GntR family transcriptional regulator of arabinose operon
LNKSPAYIRVAEQIKTRWLSNNEAQSASKLPTQEELAEHLGVSRSTIVRALSRLVAEGCIRSQQGSGAYAAAAPSARTVPCLSLIVPNLTAEVIVSACRGVERRARQLGYQVMLASSEFGLAHEQELVEQHLSAGAQGVVLYPVTRNRQDVKDDYLTHWSHSAPVVTLDIACDEWPCSRVQLDNFRLGYDMTQQLLKHGKRRIAFMHTAENYLHTSIHDRQKGWTAAMEDSGRQIPQDYKGWPISLRDFSPPPPSDAEYEAFAQSLIKLEPRPDAVIAWNDVSAAHLIQALMNLGVRVPEDMLVTGFDGETLITRLFRPLFPTSRPDFMRLGELAVDALVRMLNNEKAKPVVYYYPVPVLWREARTNQTRTHLEIHNKDEAGREVEKI